MVDLTDADFERDLLGGRVDDQFLMEDYEYSKEDPRMASRARKVKIEKP